MGPLQFSCFFAALTMVVGYPSLLGWDYSTTFSALLQNNLTAQRRAMMALRDTTASRVKIYTADRVLMGQLADVWGAQPLQMMIAVCNPELASLAEGRESFVAQRLEYLLDTVSMFSHQVEFIAVGNEVEYPESNNDVFAPLLLPVLEAIHSGLTRRGFHHVRLTSPFSDMLIPDEVAVVGPSNVNMFTDTYDSAQGCNDVSCMDHHPVPLMHWILPILDFYNRTGGAFSMSMYPFFKWRNLATNSWCHRYGPCSNVPLSFAVGAPGAEPFVDNVTGLVYHSLMAVLVDAVRFGLAKLGYPNLPLVVGETGWPTGGLADAGANGVSACHFTNAIVQMMREGTPGAPGVPPQIYLFQWTDEAGKWQMFGRPEDPGPIEDHWGVLSSRLQPKFHADWDSGAATCEALPAEPTPWHPSLVLSMAFFAIGFAAMATCNLCRRSFAILRLPKVRAMQVKDDISQPLL